MLLSWLVVVVGCCNLHGTTHRAYIRQGLLLSTLFNEVYVAHMFLGDQYVFLRRLQK
jgi:hypothetical protein